MTSAPMPSGAPAYDARTFASAEGPVPGEGGDEADELGEFSIGSQGHQEGTCKPCAFSRSSAGCKFGSACAFCHLPSHAKAARLRPCKGKRERTKRQMARLEDAVAMDPDLFTNGGLELPALIDCSPAARARMMSCLAKVAADAFMQRSNGGAGAAGFAGVSEAASSSMQ